jgi:hypothetical protein
VSQATRDFGRTGKAQRFVVLFALEVILSYDSEKKRKAFHGRTHYEMGFIIGFIIGCECRYIKLSTLGKKATAIQPLSSSYQLL